MRINGPGHIWKTLKVKQASLASFKKLQAIRNANHISANKITSCDSLTDKIRVDRIKIQETVML